MKTKGFLLCLLTGCIVCFFSTSCERSTLLNKTYDTPQPAWAYHEPICFDITVQDSTLPYDVTFTLKHSRDFAWMNAFFFITTIFPDMNTTIDTLECVLATPDGRWIGSRYGKYRNIEFLYKQHIRFPIPGQYRFEIRHAMRNDSLQNINAVGLKIKRA